MMQRPVRLWRGAYLAVGVAAAVCWAPQARAGGPDKAVYKPAYQYPVLEEIREAREARQAERDSLRERIDQYYEDEARRKKDEKRSLRIDGSGVWKPTGPEAFASAFHFPPVPQYATGTCWAFCSTSFFESEVQRRTAREIKLSEMWTVYWEFVEKARRFVREYGHAHFSSGSQDGGTREIYRQYGVVPAEAYPGILTDDGRHDHTPMARELRRYLTWVEDNDLWDEEKVIRYVRTILDYHLGVPPEHFAFEGETYTPRAFLREVLQLDMDDYINLVSTMTEPFGEWILHDVHDNWRRSRDFLNLRLETFYAVIRSAVQDGYTVSLGGDVSEPGLDGMEDAARIPSWDIPSEFIDQASRELRIYNGTTTDDHGVHTVGYLKHGGEDWFLIKDSNRSSRLGRFKGYYFYAGDYIRLKMLGCMVHRDRVADLLPSEPPPR